MTSRQEFAREMREKGYVPTREAAERVGVNHSSIYRLARKGHVRGYRLGRALYVHAGDVEDYYRPRPPGGGA